MKSFKVVLSSVIEVNNFVNAVNEFDFDVELVSGGFVVDAKSMMAIFSLELASPLTMRVYCEETDDFEKALGGFIVY
ncbi:MAG: HPr family phosphocarrier protein [Clostridia bacterium]|nr:HPr family phosphocarrier protein [Clostridia bacterium]